MTENRPDRTDPNDVGVAKAEVERSRERLSETLDAIEHRLVETKLAIRERVNVLRPVQEQVRSRPWVAVAVAAGAGAALGALFGGDKPAIIAEPERHRRREWRERRRERMHGGDTQARGGVRIATGPERRPRRRSRRGGALRAVRRELMRTIAAAIGAGLRERALHGNGQRDSGAARGTEPVIARGYEEGGLGRRPSGAHQEAESR